MIVASLRIVDNDSDRRLDAAQPRNLVGCGLLAQQARVPAVPEQAVDEFRSKTCLARSPDTGDERDDRSTGIGEGLFGEVFQDRQFIASNERHHLVVGAQQAQRR